MIPATPLASSSHFIPAMSLATTTNNAIETAIANNILPSFGAVLPPILVTKVKRVMIPTKASMPTIPLPISSHVILEISFITTAKMARATAILKSIGPIFPAFLPARFEAAISPTKNNSRTKITDKPFSKSRVPMFAISLITPTRIRRAIENVSNVLPRPPIFCALLPLTRSPNAAMRTPSSTINPVIPINPCFACSGLSEPIRLMTVAKIRNAAEIPISPRVIEVNFILPAPILSDNTAKPETTNTSAANIPVIAARTPTASHSLSLSTNVSRITAPINSDSANIRFLIALTLTLKARPFRYLPNPDNACPAPERISPRPSNGLANLLIAFAKVVIAYNTPPLRATAIRVPQLILLMISAPLETMFLSVSQTNETPF